MAALPGPSWLRTDCLSGFNPRKLLFKQTLRPNLGAPKGQSRGALADLKALLPPAVPTLGRPHAGQGLVCKP